MSEEHLMTPKEVASYLQVSTITVFRLFQAGELPGIPILSGRKRNTVRFRLSDIEAWTQEQENSFQRNAERVKPEAIGAASPHKKGLAS